MKLSAYKLKFDYHIQFHCALKLFVTVAWQLNQNKKCFKYIASCINFFLRVLILAISRSNHSGENKIAQCHFYEWGGRLPLSLKVTTKARSECPTMLSSHVYIYNTHCCCRGRWASTEPALAPCRAPPPPQSARPANESAWWLEERNAVA